LIKNLSFKWKMALFVVPLVGALLAFATGLVKPRLETAQRAEQSRAQASAALSSMELIDELMAERGSSMWVRAGDPAAAEQLTEARTAVDEERTQFAAAVADANGLSEESRKQLTLAEQAVAEVEKLRREVDAQVLSTTQIFDEYTAVLDSLRNVAGSLGTDTADVELTEAGTSAFNIMLAKHQYGELRDLIVARTVGGTLDANDLSTIIDREARRQLYLTEFRRGAGSDAQTRFATIDNSAQSAIAADLIEQARVAASADASPEFDATAWWVGMTGVVDTYDTVEQVEFELVLTLSEDLAGQERSSAIRYMVLAGFAVLVAATVAFVISRSLTRRLRSMSDQAQHIATVRLPEVLEVLRNPSREDLAAALPQVQADATDEIGSMASAFNAVLSTAVETGLEHAERRAQTVTNMLVNLGRRNQALIDRQLQVMDRLESTVQDPDVLQGLFDVDHMVTRMRRNAENLLVLAGHQQSRSWTAPVPLADVLQGAASESPDMTRVDIEVDPAHNIEMSGAYAVDISHIVAELVENALAYSSPATQVVLRTERGKQGEIVVQVLDSGVGMTDEDRDAANERLASPLDIDEIVTDRVGFQVVSRMAQRLDVLVELTDKPGGGTIANVTLPKALFSGEDRDASSTGNPVKKQRDDSVFKKVEGRRAGGSEERLPDEDLLAEDLQTLLSGPDAPAVAPAPPDPAEATAPAGGPSLVKRQPGTAYTGNTKAAAADAGVFKRLPDAPAGAAAAPTPDAAGGDADAEAAFGRFQAMSALQSAVLQGRTDTDDTPATTEEP
jgi:signal transduction histidine kinase